jgi:hypothetical protein
MSDKQTAAAVMRYIDERRGWWDECPASELAKVMAAITAVVGEVRYEVLTLVLERVGTGLSAGG